MLYYNWTRIVRVSKGKANKIIGAIESMMPNASTRIAKHYQRAGFDFTGTSFLVNPEPLITKRHLWGRVHIANYIGLAALRSRAEYMLTGNKYLEVEKSPLSVEDLKKNDLLTIRNNKIYFYYEEQ